MKLIALRLTRAIPVTIMLLCASLASASDSVFPERIPLLTRSDLFLRQASNDTFRLNADGKKLAFMNRDTKKLMITSADCPACEDQLAPA
ncbi:MAG: hypothetical protein RL748_4447, partial [Pseudomonadota bacterium]